MHSQANIHKPTFFECAENHFCLYKDTNSTSYPNIQQRQTVHWKWCPQLQMKRKGKNITTFVIFKIKCQHVLLLLFFLLPLVRATVHFMFYSYLSLLHRIRRRRKRKIVITISNGKIMFVCRLIWDLSAF